MKLASEIAGMAYDQYGYSSDATGKTGIDIQVDELESLVARELEPVRDALNCNVQTMSVRGDMPIMLAMNKEALALFEEE